MIDFCFSSEGSDVLRTLFLFFYKENGRISPTVDLDLPQLTKIR